MSVNKNITNETPKKAALYVRVSTSYQADKDSLPMQRQELIAYAKLMFGIEDYVIFEDAGYSGIEMRKSELIRYSAPSISTVSGSTSRMMLAIVYGIKIVSVLVLVFATFSLFGSSLLSVLHSSRSVFC